jgi:hypothetical protein
MIGIPMTEKEIAEMKRELAVFDELKVTKTVTNRRRVKK